MNDLGVNETGTDAGTIRAEFDKLREELARIRDMITSSLRDSGAEILSANKAAAESRLSALQAEVQKLAAQVKGQGTEMLQQIDHQIQDRPLTSLFVAFGVGVLAAQLLRR